MYAIAEQVRRWLADGREVYLAQVIETIGFSSRDPSSVLAWTAGLPPVGELLEGIASAAVTDAGPGYLTITVDDRAAEAAGLSCGGSARVLVLPASAFPGDLWDRLVGREPICLTTEVAGDVVGRTHVFTPATIRDAFSFADAIPRLFGRGTSLTTVVDSDQGPLAVVSLWPITRMVVVGDGLIASALAAAGGLLDWDVQVVDDGVDEIGSLHRCDAVVVLSHDRAVDGPALQAALGSQVGYVGALGSRRTQAARREWLGAHTVSEESMARIHGPAGLDIDAHTPAEIAVSIVAEILSSRSASSGGALRDRSGPVHVAGVRTPPPRYPAG